MSPSSRLQPNRTVDAGDPGRYDALKVITDLRASQNIYENWDDDVFEVPG